MINDEDDFDENSLNLNGKADDRKTYGLHFPYYDYDDEDYCKFMIQLMKNLEYREYKAGEVFIEELDEC